MTGYISDEVIAAILAGETTITRRVEFYEADGLTRWAGDDGTSRIKAGQVSVDSTRDARRNLDLTIDNSDGKIIHDPMTGLWYDKIIKVFRGVKYENLKTDPLIGVLNVDANVVSPLTTLLRRLGFNRFAYYPDANLVTVDTLLNCDIVAAFDNTANFDAVTYGLLQQAYSLGANILTFNNHATSTSVPLITTTVVRSGTTAWDISNPSGDSEFKSYLQEYLNPAVNAETVPTVISGRPAGVSTYSGNPAFAAIYQDDGIGRWFHYHPKIDLNYTPQFHVARELAFLKSGINWLYHYGDEHAWETQIGEFMINTIKEASFPHEIAITGVDYQKKLARIKLDSATSWATGTDVDTLVKSLAALAGLTKFRINSHSAKLATLQSFDRTTDYWTIIKTCTDSVNIEVFFDAAGYLVVRPYQDPTKTPVSFDLTIGGDTGNVVSFNRSSDDTSMYNRVIVTGVSSDTSINDGIKFQAIAENNTPSSPTRISRLGRIDYYYSSEFFTNVQQCQDYANRLLSVMALENYTFDFEALVAPWLEAGEIVKVPVQSSVVPATSSGSSQPIITNPVAVGVAVRAPEAYLLSSFNIPLGLETMSGTAKRVAIIDPTEYNSLLPFGGIDKIVVTT